MTCLWRQRGTPPRCPATTARTAKTKWSAFAALEVRCNHPHALCSITQIVTAVAGDACAGFIVHKRVMGELAITRALGDIDYKESTQLVIATPEIREV